MSPKSYLRPLAVVALALLAAIPAARPARAMTIDASAAAAALAASRPVAGTVREPVSRRDPDGVLRTQVTLEGPAGQEVARFDVLGGAEGGVYWVVDGVPAFVTGEMVEVSVVDAPGGLSLVPGEEAVRRLAPSSTGRSGSTLADLPSTVAEVAPSVGAAVPDVPFVATVHGSGFGDVQGDSRVTFQGIFERVDAAVVSWSDHEITCLVPAPTLRGTTQVLSGPVKVWTAAGGWSDGNEFIGGARYSVLYQWAGDAWRPGRLPIPIYVNPEGSPWGDELGSLVAEASSQWNVQGSYARLVYAGLTTADAGSHNGRRTPRDGRNTVRWRTEWPYTSSILALTWSAIDTLTLEREETELEINGTVGWTLDPEGEPQKFDLPSTLAHEFGHWLRLGHTQSVASVMLAFVNAGVRRRQVSPGDRFGASWIHPSYGEVTAPASVASGASVDLGLIALDRQGNPIGRMPRDGIAVRAVLLPEDDPDAVNPVGPPLPGGPVGGVPATKDTDDEGRTTVVLDGLADGLYRIEAKVGSQFVRPAPVVRVGVAPVPPVLPLSLAGVTPHPLSGGVRGLVRFSLPASAQVRFDLYDASGRLVRTLANEHFEAGAHEIVLETRGGDGRTAPSGVYFLRMAPVAGLDFEPRTSRVVVLR